MRVAGLCLIYTYIYICKIAQNRIVIIREPWDYTIILALLAATCVYAL